MLIAITGHTSGLGKAFFDRYTAQGEKPLGISRQTGFDLRDWKALQKMLDLTANFDLIISNAKPDFFQTVLLYEMVKRPNRAKKIISIGSTIINHQIDPTQDSDINLYKTQKLALQNAHRQLTEKFKNLDSILVHPGHLYNKDNIDYQKLENWVVRFELVLQSNSSSEIYVE